MTPTKYADQCLKVCGESISSELKVVINCTHTLWYHYDGTEIVVLVVREKKIAT